MPLYAQLILVVVGPAVGATIALLGVWLNTRTTAAQAAAGRATEHTSQLREDIAKVLAERPYILGSQQTFFSTAFLHFGLEGSDNAPPPEQLYTDRDRYFVRCNALKQMSIRASLLTSNPKIVTALQSLREIAEDSLRPMEAARGGGEPAKEFRLMYDALSTAFDELESATRQVTAADPKL
ncbi:hypothetical protein H7J86_25420 [Mycobacterium hackensackense]|uniref:hypothetical protein n=1 Tax=Mycobacterium hackensackense TaxID=228909 RepID=UPI002265F1BD|nr:hypothetical protein [Mycobacterium hackensackense]MCV7255506.1 hypothetical protein [Mycobacterium hackensackense]